MNASAPLILIALTLAWIASLSLYGDAGVTVLATNPACTAQTAATGRGTVMPLALSDRACGGMLPVGRYIATETE